AAGFVQIDRFVTRADRADDLELRQHFHLVAAQAAAAIGQNGPHAFACLAHGVNTVFVLLALAHGVAGRAERGDALGTEGDESQNTDSHDRFSALHCQAFAVRCARRNVRTWRTATGILSFVSFQGYMPTSYICASIADSMAIT